MLAQAGVNEALAVPVAVAALPKKERVVMTQFAKDPAVPGFLDRQAGSVGAANNAIGGCQGVGELVKEPDEWSSEYLTIVGLKTRPGNIMEAI